MFGDDKLDAGFGYAGKEFRKLRFGLKGPNCRYGRVHGHID
jgi:hypothetical protein